MARHTMRESRSLTLARFVQTLLLDIHFRRRRIVHSVTVTSEMTKTNVVVFVLAPVQRHIIIIIIINFYDAHILRNLSSEAQKKTESLSIIVNRDAQKSVSERGTTEQ